MDANRGGAGALGRDIQRRIEAERPSLVASYQNYLAAAEAVAAVDEAALVALYKLTYATEYAYVEPRGLVAVALARGELDALADLLYTIGRRDYRYARALLEAYPGLGFPLGRIEGEVRNLALATAEGAAKGYDTLADCLRYRDPEDCRFMLRQMAVLARRAPAAMPEFERVFRERRGSLPWPVLRAWIARGADLVGSERVDEGVRHLLLRSGEGRRMLGLGQAVLEEYKPVLRIYAASLAGREFAINGLELSLYRLRSPYTDGATIFLPAELAWFADEERNRRSYSALAALQAASVRIGSFALDFAALGFRAELADRYGTLLPEVLPNLRRQYAGMAETIRERRTGEVEAVFPRGRVLALLETEHEKLFFSLPTPVFARELFCLVENSRLAARLGASYPGLGRDFEMIDERLLGARPVSGPREGSDAEAARFDATVEAVIRVSLAGSREAAIDALADASCVGAARLAFRSARSPGATAQDSAAAMFGLYNAFFGAFRLERLCKGEDVRALFDGAHKVQLFPEVVRAVRPELLLARAELPSEPGEAEDDEPRAVDLSALRGSPQAGADDALRRAIAGGSVKIFRYPEYDRLRGSYVRRRCTLFESTPPSRPDGFCAEALRRHALARERIKKRFLAMKSDETELSRGWYEGPEINVSDAVDYCMGLRRGESPDDKIYCRKVLSRRDLAVAVLLDSSNSTDFELGGRRVIDVEKDSLAVLASALDAIDDTFALFAFNSSGPAKVRFSVIKDFGERWDEDSKGRFWSIEPYESNRDGCAIRHATARLRERPERAKLLLLLSDGIPADVDYGTQAGRDAGAYAIEDTRRAILEAREGGVFPFCLTVDSRAKDYIARLYGPYRFALLDDAARLPERLARLYLRLTG